jgi:hypothetical protein
LSAGQANDDYRALGAVQRAAHNCPSPTPTTVTDHEQLRHRSGIGRLHRSPLPLGDKLTDELLDELDNLRNRLTNACRRKVPAPVPPARVPVLT